MVGDQVVGESGIDCISATKIVAAVVIADAFIVVSDMTIVAGVTIMSPPPSPSSCPGVVIGAHCFSLHHISQRRHLRLLSGPVQIFGLGREDHPSRTNQQFILVRSDILAELSSKVAFEVWQETPPGAPGFALCRFVTSWATVQEDISELEKVLMALC